MLFKKDLNKIKEKCCEELLRKRNVVGVGIGYKIKGGKATKTKSILVFVKEKLPEPMLLEKDLVPKKVEGVVTDVIEIGELWELDVKEESSIEHRLKYRPSSMGVSIGHYPLVTAGTAGCLVAKNGKTYILTNAHVAFPSYNGAKQGDQVVQPGRVDSSTANTWKCNKCGCQFKLKQDAQNI